MSSIFKISFGVMLPLIGTTLGAAMVFLMKDKIMPPLEKFLIGIASGVMIAASIWSLLIPSIEMSDKLSVAKWLPPAVGFFAGVLFLLVLDTIIRKLNHNSIVHSKYSQSKKSTMLMLAVTLHNIPEGMAVGVVLSGALDQSTGISLMSALVLSLGISIQNFPEGAIISLPLASSGISKRKAFLRGFLSGIVEPISAVITMLLTSLVTPILPYILAFAAGAMIYVVVKELIPEAQQAECDYECVLGCAAGFVLMMVLDVALG